LDRHKEWDRDKFFGEFSGWKNVCEEHASKDAKTVNKLYELLDSLVEEIGEQNVVQLINDNVNNYVMAGKLLSDTRPHMFWTQCPAHCIDLMLEDIKIPKVKKVIQRGVSFKGYIYSQLRNETKFLIKFKADVWL